MKLRISLVTGMILLFTVAYINAQSNINQLKEIQGIVKQEGDLFIAIDRPNPESNKNCLEENSIINHVQFTADSAFINYINYTELFCEVYVMRTQYTYQFHLKDIDPTALRLVEKKYHVGNGKLKEGNPGWFEVQLFTKDKKAAITKRDIDTKQKEIISTVSLIVKEKETAKQILNLLKSSLLELQSQ